MTATGKSNTSSDEYNHLPPLPYIVALLRKCLIYSTNLSILYHIFNMMDYNFDKSTKK